MAWGGVGLSSRVRVCGADREDQRKLGKKCTFSRSFMPLITPTIGRFDFFSPFLWGKFNYFSFMSRKIIFQLIIFSRN